MVLKRRIGVTAWQEFSDDMQQGIRQIQDTSAFKKTAEGISAVKVREVKRVASIEQRLMKRFTSADKDSISIDLPGLVKLFPKHD